MADETTHVLRAEGINFAATLYDTNDISTIRGAGLALLEAIKDVDDALRRHGLTDLTRIFAGASQAAFSFRADIDTANEALKAVRAVLAGEPPAPTRSGAPPLRHLMFVADLAPLAGDSTHEIEAALAAAEALNRARQFREFTMKLPDPGAKSPGPDPLDHSSQGVKTFRMPGDKEDRLYSRSVIDRHNYGRDQRAKFYTRADGMPLDVCRSLQEVVDFPPSGLRASPRGKLAYLYADGNRFSAIRAKVGTKVFSEELEKLQTPLLRQITGWLREGLKLQDLSRVAPIDKTGLVRFETLLWGGDEFLFVMPAWLGLHVLGELVTAMAGWKICGHELTFAFGMAICDVKTPVRQARETAHRLAESVKDAMGATPRSGAAIQVYESQNLIDAPLKTQRSLLFGISPKATEHLDKALIIDAAALPCLPKTIRTLTDEGAHEGTLSGTTLHAAITAARAAPDGLLSDQGKAAALKVLEDAFTRFGHCVPRVEIPGFVTRGLVLDLCLVAMLRDYCALPESGSLPPFPAVTP